MKWSNRERKLNNRRKLKLQDRAHKEKGQGKDKQSKKRMAKVLKEHRKFENILVDDDDY
jgi:hypothetical protein